MIRLHTLVLLLLPVLMAPDEPPPSDGPDFVPLCDGTTLQGWKIVGGSAQYHLEDGAIVGVCDPASPKNTFLRTERLYRDFIFACDVKADVGGNSGIQFRSEQIEGDGDVYGYQMEVDPLDQSPSGNVWDECRRNRFLGDSALAETGRKAFRRGEWNHYVIRAVGRRIETWINGTSCADFIDEEPEFTSEGFLALQVHSGSEGIFRWRNLRIRELDAQRYGSDPNWTPPARENDAPWWWRVTEEDWSDARLSDMNTGPFLHGTTDYPGPKGSVRTIRGIALRLGDAADSVVLFDRNQMRFAAGWTNGFLRHSAQRFGLHDISTPAGKMRWSTSEGLGFAAPNGRWDSKLSPSIPLPLDWAQYRGLHLHGSHAVISYTVQDAPVLDAPWTIRREGLAIFTRSVEIGASTHSLKMLAAEFPTKELTVHSTATAMLATCTLDRSAEGVALLHPAAGIQLANEGDGRIAVLLSPSESPRHVQLLHWSGAAADLERFASLTKSFPPLEPPSKLFEPGPKRWTAPIVTSGIRAPDDAPYVLDTLTLPHDNPYRALLFVTGVDFFTDGTLAISTAHGDVWLVRGVDEALEKIQWIRFATGLYQPLGLKIVNDVIYVLERGQLTRLIDRNQDGEADDYECFNHGWYSDDGVHSFDTCLETDADGNFYFFKTGGHATPTGGSLLRVTKDGSRCEVFCSGFRHPIGLGISPNGWITGGDQEGNWMPSTRIDLYHQGGFYGDMRTHHRQVAPTTYDPPLCWLPRELDNSAGGQVTAPSEGFGLLSGRLLHFSWGSGRLILLMPQKVEDLWQAAAVDTGVQFLAGSICGRFHPRDGHLYVAGLNGWQTRADVDGCLQRVRYTGKALRLPLHFAAYDDCLRIEFSCPLDPTLANDAKNFHLEQWNYRWREEYGSPRFSAHDPGRIGTDVMPIQSAVLEDDGKTVRLAVDGLAPVMQMQLHYRLRDLQGAEVEELICNTIHRLDVSRH